jgi:hypothetical protein
MSGHTEWTVPAGQWPVRTGTEYAEDGPQVLCDAWTTRTIITGKVIREPCGTAIPGSTLDELRSALEQHMSNTRHTESPYATIMRGAVPQ